MKLARLIFLVGSGIFLIVATYGWLNPQSRKEVVIHALETPVNLKVIAPPFFNRNGSVFFLYEGTTDGSTTIELSSSGRLQKTIHLTEGFVSGMWGGAENWDNNLNVRFTTGTATKCEIYAVAYCGVGMTDEDHQLFRRLKYVK